MDATAQDFKARIIQMLEKINDKEILRKVYTLICVWIEPKSN